jgi:molybdopterin molybdotransferase
VRLFTGSVVADGADAVVLQEDTTRDGDSIVIDDTIQPGQHIRRAGQDFRAGDVLVAAGTRLTPRQVGLIASGNHAWVSVHRRPVVAILATGDEIVLPGESVPPGGIVSSNSHALAGLIRACGGIPMLLPIAPDDRATIAAAAASAAGCDMLVTSGGASVGDHDLIAQALGAQGLALDFWKIAMRPGKPLMSGRLGRLPLLGLPGNPVSAYLCALLFLKPAIERLSGLPGDAPMPVAARLGADLPANDHRADHLRCRLSQLGDGTLVATAASRQDSGMIRVLAEADAVILRAPHAKRAEAGETVMILRLDQMAL